MVHGPLLSDDSASPLKLETLVVFATTLLAAEDYALMRAAPPTSAH